MIICYNEPSRHPEGFLHFLLDIFRPVLPGFFLHLLPQHALISISICFSFLSLLLSFSFPFTVLLIINHLYLLSPSLFHEQHGLACSCVPLGFLPHCLAIARHVLLPSFTEDHKMVASMQKKMSLKFINCRLQTVMGSGKYSLGTNRLQK